MANKSNWKGFERDLAKLFGTERNPLSGSNSKHTGSDTLHPYLYVEAKKRKSFALFELYRDTKRKARKEDKTPVVAIKETGRPQVLLLIDPDDLPRVCDCYLEAKRARIDMEIDSHNPEDCNG